MNRKIAALAMFSAAVGLTVRADVSRAVAADSAAEWQGSYHYHLSRSTMDWWLDIKHDSRYTLTLGGCFGKDVVSRGTVEYRDGKLQVKPSRGFEETFGRDSNIFLPVRYAKRLYLVNENRVGEFEEATRSGTIDCRGGECADFFLSEKDRDPADEERLRWMKKYADELRRLRSYPAAPSSSTQSTPGIH